MALTIRWTIGDVSAPGFEALGLSLASAVRLFGLQAHYVVCVNTLSLDAARARVSSPPPQVEWIDNSRDLPPVLAGRFDAGMSEGVGWKLAPLRLAPGQHELALDNDVILWSLPEALETWLAQDRRCLIAQDVERCLGQFDTLCPPGAYNSGIRGLPPGYDFERAMREVLRRRDAGAETPVQLRSELDEQGLQVAAVSVWSHPLVVRTEEVSICSPFWPKKPEFGSCGAHFVGLNARHLPWNYYDRPADDWMHEHWAHQRPRLQAKVTTV